MVTQRASKCNSQPFSFRISESKKREKAKTHYSFPFLTSSSSGSISFFFSLDADFFNSAISTSNAFVFLWFSVYDSEHQFLQLLPQTQVIYSIFLGLVFKLSVAGDDPVLDNGDNGDCLLDLEELGLEARLFLAEEGNERGILGKKNKNKKK